MEVIDAHIHIFSTERRRKQLRWLDPDHTLFANHSYNDYSLAGTPACAAVFIECDTNTSPDFHEALEEVSDASKDDRIKAIVAWAPLTDIRLLKIHLDQLVRFDTRNLVNGIRVLLQDKPDGFCRATSFLECVRHLGSVGLSFAIGIDVHRRGTIQLEDALFLIKSAPNTIFVIDHLAKPDLSAAAVDQEYSAILADIASRTNVYMKLSGCFTELPSEATLPHAVLFAYIELNLRLFGARRLLFGSDWPVLGLTSANGSVDKTPQGWYNYCQDTLHRLGATEDDKQQIFSGNARRIYHISGQLS